MMDPSRILPNLLVGSFPREAEDVARLVWDFGVTAVLNVQTDEDFADWGVNWRRMTAVYDKAGIVVRRVPVRDFDPEDLRRRLPECVQVLSELLDDRHTVYLHCNMGINRSPTIAIAYLHWVEGWELPRAVDHLARWRACEPYLDAIQSMSLDRPIGD